MHDGPRVQARLEPVERALEFNLLLGPPEEVGIRVPFVL